MKSLTKQAVRFIAAVALLCGVGTTTQAQVIRLGNSAAAPVAPAPPAYTCVATSSTNVQTLFFDPQTSQATDINWRIEGASSDYTLISTPPLNGSTIQFYPTGFGKIRVSVDYYINTGTTTGQVTCGGSTVTCTYPVRSRATVTTEFYKQFSNSNYVVKGPTCVPANNPSVVYSIDPAILSSVAQIQSGIGTDSYTWSGVYTSGPNTGSAVPISTSGDGSTIVIRGVGDPAGTALNGSFNLTVQAGRCNAASTTTLNVVVAPDIASAVTSNFPSCLPIGTTSTTFTLNTQTGVTYTLNAQISGATISPASVSGDGTAKTITLTNLGTTSTGNITIIGVGNSGACFGTQTLIKRLERQLVASQNQISQACVAPNSTVTLSLTNPPVGQTITWTRTAGTWTIVSGQGTANIQVATGTGSATFTVQAGTCNNGGTGIITKTIGVTGPVAGCTFNVTNSDPSTPGCAFTATASGSCPTSSNRYTAWRLYNGASTTALEVKNIAGSAQFNPSVAFDYQTPLSGTARVEVDVVNTSATGQCLSATYSTPGLDFEPCVFFRSTLGSSTGATSASEALRAYPNPTSGILQVDLTLTKGTAKLTLIDALGRVQQKSTTTQAHSSLDVSRLAEGVYTLRAELPGGKVVNQAVQVKH
jgi:hypothetical protein